MIKFCRSAESERRFLVGSSSEIVRHVTDGYVALYGSSLCVCTQVDQQNERAEAIVIWAHKEDVSRDSA